MKKLVYLLSALFCFWVEGWSQAVRSFQKEKERIVFKMTDGELQLYPLSSNTIRVKFVKQPSEMSLPEWVYINNETEKPFTVKEGKEAISVKLPGMTAQVDKETGLVTFLSPEGNTVLREYGRGFAGIRPSACTVFCSRHGYLLRYTEILYA